MKKLERIKFIIIIIIIIIIVKGTFDLSKFAVVWTKSCDPWGCWDLYFNTTQPFLVSLPNSLHTNDVSEEAIIISELLISKITGYLS